MTQELKKLLELTIPNDHSNQVTSEYYIDQLLTNKSNDELKVLDLGCGSGRSIHTFRLRNSKIEWFGLDIASSSEVDSRDRNDASFYTFDGINIPFEDNYFDIVYSNQVFEHVRYPTELLEEVYRVLKSGGYFIGSVSYLEPFHSLSFWNYTPYGFKVLVEKSGLILKEIRPSIDSITLIIAVGLGIPKFFRRWWQQESPLNYLIGIAGKLKKFDHAKINSTKLMFCGQFCFLTIK